MAAIRNLDFSEGRACRTCEKRDSIPSSQRFLGESPRNFSSQIPCLNSKYSICLASSCFFMSWFEEWHKLAANRCVWKWERPQWPNNYGIDDDAADLVYNMLQSSRPQWSTDTRQFAGVPQDAPSSALPWARWFLRADWFSKEKLQEAMGSLQIWVSCRFSLPDFGTQSILLSCWMNFHFGENAAWA